MTNCSRECDRASPCPFVSDPRRSTRYVCLKCGLDRDLRPSGGGNFFVSAIAVFLLLLLLSSLTAGKKPPNPPPANRDRASSLLPSTENARSLVES